jgi:hypothetical protein
MRVNLQTLCPWSPGVVVLQIFSSSLIEQTYLPTSPDFEMFASVFSCDNCATVMGFETFVACLKKESVAPIGPSVCWSLVYPGALYPYSSL